MHPEWKTQADIVAASSCPAPFVPFVVISFFLGGEGFPLKLHQPEKDADSFFPMATGQLRVGVLHLPGAWSREGLPFGHGGHRTKATN